MITSDNVLDFSISIYFCSTILALSSAIYLLCLSFVSSSSPARGRFQFTACEPTIYVIVSCLSSVPRLPERKFFIYAGACSALAFNTRANWVAGVLSNCTSLVGGATNRPSSFARNTSMLGRSARAARSFSSRRALFR